MRPIRWLHISDLHLREQTKWAQDVVLQAMHRYALDHIQHDQIDFILLTGDLAFSGSATEYKLVMEFLQALCAAAHLSEQQVYCVPGNHDIARLRQRLSFEGARASLTSQNQIDLLLETPDSLKTLLEREASYREFQQSFMFAQPRASIPSALGYVANIAIDNVRLAIVALDSAWVADGDATDHKHLLIGERQVREAWTLLRTMSPAPHVVIGMAHHPVHLLHECDRAVVQSHIERECHFFHCGHLHQPEIRATGFTPAGCLSIAVGATFETRYAHNAFASITLDLANGSRCVECIQYDPLKGEFERSSTEMFPVDLRLGTSFSLEQLAAALTKHCPDTAPWAHYLAAILMDHKNEVPIPTVQGVIFATASVMAEIAQGDAHRRTSAFLAFRSPLRILADGTSIDGVLREHGRAVGEYARWLVSLVETAPGLRERLDVLDAEAQRLGSSAKGGAFAFSVTVLEEACRAQDWESILALAPRYLDGAGQEIAAVAHRSLALALASSGAPEQQAEAVVHFEWLIERGLATPNDSANLVTVLLDMDAPQRAKEVVLQAMHRHRGGVSGRLLELGHRIAMETGDREMRTQLSMQVPSESAHD